jgi:NAD(P)-dependent dehydrogenase (short-subunit alcohol dehydrogenase family)
MSASPEQVSRAVEDVLSRCGRIDVLINNAGVSLAGPVEATSDAEALALFDTNLFGALRMTRAVLPAMRQQSSGVIINVSSVLGFLPAPFMGLYASSKHALEGLRNRSITKCAVRHPRGAGAARLYQHQPRRQRHAHPKARAGL